MDAIDTGSCCACIVLILSLQKPSEVEKKKVLHHVILLFERLGANPVACIFTESVGILSYITC